VLALSILIVLALALAVASFLIVDAQWLLVGSAALVFFAFYLSRRASRASSGGAAEGTNSADGTRQPRPPVLEPLKVTVDAPIEADTTWHHRYDVTSASDAREARIARSDNDPARTNG
jgi:membrane protein implicated in regulation of membrane protease activity